MKEYDEWKEEYYTQKIVDLNKEFTEKDFATIKRLGIALTKEKHTEREFEELYAMVLSFYDEEKDKPKDVLKEFDVSEEQYIALLGSFKKVNEKYNF